MKVLLLSGYRKSPNPGMTCLNGRIAELQALGLEPVVVISGNDADDLLRQNRLLPDCELVFDTNEAVNLLTNVRAGLAGLDHACFTIPVELPIPPASVWISLKRAWQQYGYDGKFHVFQPVDGLGTLCHYGFPLLINDSGRDLLLKTGDLTGLTDPRVKFYHNGPTEAEPLAPSS